MSEVKLFLFARFCSLYEGASCSLAPAVLLECSLAITSASTASGRQTPIGDIGDFFEKILLTK
jgi:hypothetical protein